ncbi:ABC transporter substrate-binding protein [Nocardioides mangrovi]|uniref:ABC transporter substrate-binding protein n=1 Tax=Nocardioides mangrovi TaxID=2874580 RepID=A0ABS7UCU5_9ACTN|nr:ABC transporter substrate-binding protein [Nocardioides mangrovi]MBZ5738690.1 ABC transporter substrate-binding protein [Nocardioides mangrovi]
MSGRGNRRTRLLAAAALLLAALTPGLALGSAGPATAAADDPVTLTIGMTNDADSLNPFVGIEATSFEMWQLTYDYLITYSTKDLSPEPSLATSWDTSDDGLTWTFHLTDKATWSDGEPLTAEDVAYTYSRIIDGGPEAATWGAYLNQVTKAEATDDTTLVLTLKKPNSSLPLLPIPIIPEHIWKDVPEDEVKTYKNEPSDGQPVVGSGPFRLVEGSAGASTYVFEANPDYWQGAPHVDRIVFQVYKSKDPMVQALIKGEVDFIDDINALHVKSLESHDDITAQSGNAPSFDEIGFNTGAVDTKTGDPIGDGNPALQDAAFRHALGYAIDTQQIIDKVYQGAGVPGSVIIPPAFSTWRWDPPADEAYSYDPDKAGQLLDEAGYTVGSDGLRTMPDGSPIGTLRLYARSESPTSLDTMNYFKEWLADIGIKADVISVESNKLTNIILDGTFDAFEWGWYVDPDPTTMLDYLTCGQLGSWSDSWYCNKKYDALYEKQAVEMDQDKRVEMVHQMQQMIYEDAPYLVTAYDTIGEAYRSDRFACFVPQPDPGGVWLFQSGTASYLSVRPASEAGDCGGDTSATAATSGSGDDGGMGTGAVIGVGVAVVVLLGLGMVLGLRRRGTAADRE